MITASFCRLRLHRAAFPGLHAVAALAVTAIFALMPARMAWADQDDAKARLVERILVLWHPDDVVVVMVQRPAADALQQVRVALQGRVTAERRDATMKAIATDVQKYIDEATPIARESARKQLATTVAPMLMQQFTEEELTQLLALLESPVKKKFEQSMPRMERALGEKVAADCRPRIDPMLQEMTKAVGLKLRAASDTP